MWRVLLIGKSSLQFCNFSGTQIQRIVTKQGNGMAMDHCTSQDN